MKCKDCMNYLLIQGYLKAVKVTDREQTEKFHDYYPIMVAYCPIVELVVDISADRECGYFTHFIPRRIK